MAPFDCTCVSPVAHLLILRWSATRCDDCCPVESIPMRPRISQWRSDVIIPTACYGVLAGVGLAGGLALDMVWAPAVAAGVLGAACIATATSPRVRLLMEQFNMFRAPGEVPNRTDLLHLTLPSLLSKCEQRLTSRVGKHASVTWEDKQVIVTSLAAQGQQSLAADSLALLPVRLTLGPAHCCAGWALAVYDWSRQEWSSTDGFVRGSAKRATATATRWASQNHERPLDAPPIARATHETNSPDRPDHRRETPNGR
jgi:hypothetical protein